MADRLGVPNADPARYVGPHTDIVPLKRFPRRPLTTDKKFPQGQLAILGKSPSTGSEGELWYLAYFDGSGDAQWKQFDISGAVAAVDDLRDQVNATIGPSGLGEIDIDGAVVANAANPSSIPLESVKSGTANTLDIQIQVATEITGAPGDKNDAGICSFDDSAFVVDVDGYVTLIGGGTPSITNSGDDAVAVSPSAGGNFNWFGLAVANATHAKPVYFKDSATPNAIDLDVQVATERTAAPGDKNDAGICSFDDTTFAVDADGYVTLVGTAVGQTITGDSGGALSPTAGNWNILGGTGVSTAGAASTLTVNVAGGGVTWTVVTAATQAAAINNGYICNRAGGVTVTLPDTAAVGSMVRIAGMAGNWVLAQNAGETVYFGLTATTTGVGGSLTATDNRDCVELVCSVADTDWIVLSSVGNITVT